MTAVLGSKYDIPFSVKAYRTLIAPLHLALEGKNSLQEDSRRSVFVGAVEVGPSDPGLVPHPSFWF